MNFERINVASFEEHISRADILVSCAGRPGFVKGSWIKPGAVVIDVGMSDAWLPTSAFDFTQSRRALQAKDSTEK